MAFGFDVPCYHPIPAYRAVDGAVRLHPPLGRENLQLPCGKCLGCRSARATAWAQRCEHEARSHRASIFATLTYSDLHLPVGGSLDPGAFSRFLKRLRKRVQPFRYFACGEYGETTGRPHYHAVLFGVELEQRSRVGAELFESPVLSAAWGLGDVRFGDFRPAAANYIAKYQLKQVGDGSSFDPETGVERIAPFLRMSRRPGIGASWLARYREDLRAGYMVVDGRRVAIPRSYARRLLLDDPELMEQIDGAKAAAALRAPVQDPDRLADGELIHKRLKELTSKRGL